MHRQYWGGYINRVSESVSSDIIKIIRGQVSLKIQTEKETLERERARLTSIHDAALKRLTYSLEVASAAGITKPVYSNGQAVKDDPDYSVALGTDGLRRKLQIEQSLTDITVMNPDFKNREYLLNQLLKIDVADIAVSPFQYQQMPSLPVRKEGPGGGLIMLLAALLGGILASGGLLLRNALNSSSRRAGYEPVPVRCQHPM